MAIYLTLLIFSESVITSDGYPQGYVGFAHFLLYFESPFVGNPEDRFVASRHILSHKSLSQFIVMLERKFIWSRPGPKSVIPL